MTAETADPAGLLAVDIVAKMGETVRGPADSCSPPEAGSALGAPISRLVKSNLRQWDLEDATRDPGASDSEVAGAKRHIDQLNADRHRLISEIDGAMAAVLDQIPSAPLATESPGMVLDRLSVLVIRLARTAEAAGRDPAQAGRVLAVEAQIAALSQAWDEYIRELRAGTRRFFQYESLKLYGSAPSARPVPIVKQ